MRIKVRWFSVFVVCVIGWGPVSCSKDRSDPPAPSRVVIVTLDTLRHDSFFGKEGATGEMPRTRAFAGRGVQFRNFYASSSSTQPTHASLFTGLHPWEHGVSRNGVVLAEELETLPERFARAGFSTAAVVASFPLHARFGFSQGIDDENYSDDFQVAASGEAWEGIALGGEAFRSQARSVADRALEALANGEGDRQFFWFHFFDPHSPYGEVTEDPLRGGELVKLARSRDPELGRALARARELYDADVRFLDEQLGRLWGVLEAAEDLPTHVVIVSDHGESFGEGGSIGHGKRLTPEQVRVPLVLVSPSLAAAVRDDVAGTVDIAPTVCSLAGLEPADFSGRDLARPSPPDPVALGMRRSFATPFQEHRTDGTRVTLRAPRFFLAREDSLYTGDGGAVFEDDDEERLITGETEQLLRERFRDFAARLGRRQARELVDPETQEALRKLGYLRGGEDQ